VPDGLTVIVGPNGVGKTNLLEAIGYLATLRSFRAAPAESLVRAGARQAVLRAEVRREGRAILLEAELVPGRRDRVQVNHQALRRTRDLLGSLQVSVFSPDDVALVKSGPAGRRLYLDELLVALRPRHDATQTELERVLKQRNALLKSAAGMRKLPPDIETTLEVWDAKLEAAGEALVKARAALVAALEPLAAALYGRLAAPEGPGGLGHVRLSYCKSWSGTLSEALAQARVEDLRRGVTTVGPHRDELELRITGMPARTHGSQGEQRSLALALRLAGHQVVTERLGTAPVLLLDDVFSELDHRRAAALVEALPPGQALLTTASGVPPGAHPEMTVRVESGMLIP
jgi:DNA replication and repair protein RecF